MIGKSNKPFVIPELKGWKAKNGYFAPSENSRIIVNDDPELVRIAREFADDYNVMFGLELKVVNDKAKAGDFIFKLKKNDELGKEGYQIDIGKVVVVTAPQHIGVYWATRTLLQIAEQDEKHKIPQGIITDFPDFASRGFMLDCGRKFIPIDFLQSYVKMMSYYKMNTFQIHLNDNGFDRFREYNWDKTYSAFRLESEIFPGLEAEDGYYTKQEFVDLQKLGESRYVTIIPEIDVPAHSLAFTHYMPEIASDKYGKDHLDLFNPKTYEFVSALFKEYLGGDDPVFRGKLVHVGTDEYSNKDQDVVEKFRYFTDFCIKEVEKYGKKAAIWGALTHAQGTTPVKSEDVLMYIWNNEYSEPDDMLKLGYDIISIPDLQVYIVPNAGYYKNYLDHENLYNTWTPNDINGKIYDYENTHQIKGGMFALWNDHVGNGVSIKDIHHRVLPAMHTLSVKMWTGKYTSLSYEEFEANRQLISEAPGQNLLGKIGNTNSLVLSKDILKTNENTGFDEIGYNYTISFDIDGKKEKKGTILFSSPFANFYLSDPIKGMLGFSRDGYLNTFNCHIKEGQKVNITVCGDNVGTRLYINGKLTENLSPRTFYYKGTEHVKKYISTLVFPLQRSGLFDSSITNLKVYNYLVEPNQ